MIRGWCICLIYCFSETRISSHILYRQNNRIIQLRQEEKSTKYTHIHKGHRVRGTSIRKLYFSMLFFILSPFLVVLCVCVYVLLSPEQIKCSKAHQKTLCWTFYLCTHSLWMALDIWKKKTNIIWKVQPKIIVL